MINFKISWGRVFLATQILSIALFVFLIWKIVPSLSRSLEWTEDKQNTNHPDKMEVQLLPQTQLSNKDDCVDVVVTTICSGGYCKHYVNSFQVLCKEVSGQ